MTVRFSIAKKIFGLAVLLLSLNIIVAGLFLYHINMLQQEMQIIASRGIPLTKALENLDKYGMRRQLAFERWYYALASNDPNALRAKEARENYETYFEKLTTEYATVQKLINQSFPREHRQEQVNEIRTLLIQIDPVFTIISTHQREVIDLQLAGQPQRAGDLLEVIKDLQATVQKQWTQLQDRISALTRQAAEESPKRELWVKRLAFIITLSAMLLGLLLAAFITRRLVKPIHSLVTGLDHVEKGNLDVELPVVSKDEIGVLTQSFNFFIRELRSKEQIKKTFGKYIDPRILDQVILQPGAADSGRRVMTVSFADLVGFTGISEHLTPSRMVNLLNRHFSLQAQAVQQNLGVIDKFIGDALMAFWGPPFSAEENHARLACQAALAQLQALAALRDELPELTGLRKNLPPIDLRIGISTGEVIVGNIGAENARSYTVIGDTVNLGQRLEQANRIYGTEILLSEAASLAAGTDFVTREIDLLVPKGKMEPIRVFELLGLQGQVPETKLEIVRRFAPALVAYRSRQWDQAESLFHSCLEVFPQDGPSRLFLDRIRHLRTQPPEEHWQGIWYLETK